MEEALLQALQSTGGGGAKTRDDLLRALMLFALSRIGETDDGRTGRELDSPPSLPFRQPEVRVRPHYMPSPS